MPLARSMLDSMHCQVPGCTHEAHGGEMFFHGRCHIEAPSKPYVQGDVVHVMCAVCGDRIASVQVSEVALIMRTREKDGKTLLYGCCGDETPSEVSYERGALHIKCVECRSPLAQIEVHDDRPKQSRRRHFLGGL